MAATIKRPVVVWIVQGLLSLFSVIVLTILIALIRQWLNSKVPIDSILTVAIVGAALFVAFAIFLLAFWDLLNRRRFGKWLGSASLIIVWLVVVVQMMMPFRPGLYGSRYASIDERLYSLISLMWFHALILAPTIGLLFSKKVNEFLDQTSRK